MSSSCYPAACCYRLGPSACILHSQHRWTEVWVAVSCLRHSPCLCHESVARCCSSCQIRCAWAILYCTGTVMDEQQLFPISKESSCFHSREFGNKSLEIPCAQEPGNKFPTIISIPCIMLVTISLAFSSTSKTELT